MLSDRGEQWFHYSFRVEYWWYDEWWITMMRDDDLIQCWWCIHRMMIVPVLHSIITPLYWLSENSGNEWHAENEWGWNIFECKYLPMKNTFVRTEFWSSAKYRGRTEWWWFGADVSIFFSRHLHYFHSENSAFLYTSPQSQHKSDTLYMTQCSTQQGLSTGVTVVSIGSHSAEI